MQDSSESSTKDAFTPPPPKSSIFDVPAPLRQLFARYPLLTYDANELPLDSPRHRDEHTLHIFTTEEDAKNGRPSFNPSCLKWQTYLRFTGLSFRLVKSNNHASPSGALPFLQPGTTTSSDPISSNKLKKWRAGQLPSMRSATQEEDIRYEAYASLLDNRIRKAWLFQLYLNPQNAQLMHRLYVTPCSTNPLVQYAISSQLRSAASLELVKASGTNIVSAQDLLRDAEEAFQALSTLLGRDDEWFFGKERPGLFDASVFAYTQLLLDDKFGWEENPLGDVLRRFGNLGRHRRRVLGVYFSG